MGQRLLVVDSDRRFIQDHQATLESTFEVEILSSTEGALSRLESGPFAAVLLCVEVSENKGYSLCSGIRRSAALHDLKVILISGKATEEEFARHQTLKGRADLYLHKPIASNALISALSPFVPIKEEDPDNPLGDIGGTDLGDEWLESLKSELEVEPMPRTGFAVAPPAPLASAPVPGFILPPLLPLPLPLSHQVTQKLPVVSKDAGKVELMEARVKDLEAKLVAKADELDKNQHELNDLRHRHDSVTRNLDDLEQRQAEAQLLHTKLQETQDALAAVEAQATQSEEGAISLREELKAALAEQQRLLERSEAANAQLSDKTQQTMDLMESNQLLQAQLEEARDNVAQLFEAERSLHEVQEQVGQLQARLDNAELTRQSLETTLQEAHAGLAAKEALAMELDMFRTRSGELEKRLEDQGGQNAELQARIQQQDSQNQRLQEQCGQLTELQNQHQQLEAQHQGLQDQHQQVESQNQQLKEQASQHLELQERHRQLEAQNQRLQEQCGQLTELQERYRQLEAQNQELQEQCGQLADLQDRFSQQEAMAQRLANEGEQCRITRDGLEKAFAELEQQVATMAANHERQQLELMAGIDEREAQLNRLNGTIDAQRERIFIVEQQKADLEGQGMAHAGQLQAITGLLSELESIARQANHLAKGTTE